MLSYFFFLPNLDEYLEKCALNCGRGSSLLANCIAGIQQYHPVGSNLQTLDGTDCKTKLE